jgi:glycosyltransferase involved in cell wall biosynthesis
VRKKPLGGALGPLERRFDRWIAERDISRARAATALVVNSSHSLEFTYRAYGRYAYVSHLGVDDEVFTPTSTSRREGVLSVGSLHAVKGHGHIIRELGLLPPAYRPPLTVVYERGTEAERKTLEELAVRLGVELSFRQGVSDSELAALYSASIAVLCAASVEPFGLTTIEALACGTPVIAVAEGGYREVIEDQRNGFLVDRRPGSMAAAIDCVVRRDGMFDAALLRGSVLPYYSWNSAALRLDDVLFRVASGERIPA